MIINSQFTIHNLISIVSPVYLAEQLVEKLCFEIIRNVSTITDNFEIILVEDGSPDDSWQAIVAAAKTDVRIKGIRLSRNFGQHAAITAGLAQAKGQWVVVMDCDLQDRPEEIPRLYAKAQEGFDSVFARRLMRRDGFFKRTGSILFYKLFSYLTETKQDASVANFGIYHKDVITAILQMQDRIRYFPTMAQWVGFRKTYLDVEHGERYAGKSTYSWKSLFKLAFDTILAFSDKPLRLTVRLGIWVTFLSIAFGIFNIIKYCLGYITEPGFISLILSIWFLGGMLIFVLGMVGLYVGKSFEQAKGRPVFVVMEEFNIQK